MRRTWWLVMATLVVAWLAAPAAEAQTKVIYLLTSPAPDVAQASHSSVPLALGYWKDAGLDVDVQPTSGSTAAAQLVLAGSAHFTMGTVEPLVIGRQKGGRLVAVYNHTREGIYTIAVPADSPITSLKQLKGQSLGVLSLGSGAVPFAKAVLRAEGFDPEKDVSWVPIGQGAQATHAVLQKRVEALASSRAPAVEDATSRSGPQDVSGMQYTLDAQMIAVMQRAFKDQRHGFEAAMRVHVEARGRRIHPILDQEDERRAMLVVVRMDHETVIGALAQLADLPGLLDGFYEIGQGGGLRWCLQTRRRGLRPSASWLRQDLWPAPRDPFFAVRPR